MFVPFILLMVASLGTAENVNSISNVTADDFSNYVIVLPNGDVRPAFLNAAEMNWDTDKPLDRIKFNTGRIVGGLRVHSRSDVPYQVGILHKDSGIHCGGAIYNADTVISAAHCFKTYRLSSLVFVFGKLSMLEAEPFEALSVAKSVEIHSAYTRESGVNDLAIVKLKVPLCFNNFTQPIPIVAPGVTPTGDVKISGWGYILRKENGDTRDDPTQYSRQLKVTTIKVVPRDQCIDIYKSSPGALPYAKHETVFCAAAGGAEPDDACQGDSGGPVACDVDGQVTLCGVISTGIGCGKPKLPAFYVDLSLPRLNEWIRLHGGEPGQPCNRTLLIVDKDKNESSRQSTFKYSILWVTLILSIS